jgi:hypothetical protein
MLYDIIHICANVCSYIYVLLGKKKFKGLVLGRVSKKKKKQYNRWQMVERIYKVSLYSEAKVWKRDPKHFNVTSANY